MAWQLIYTSTPRGLVAGRSGFCTVARHAEIRERLVVEIERCSAMDRSFSQIAGAGTVPPVIAAHRIVDLGDATYHVLSMIQDAGLDYTGRTNHIAHHLICEEHELSAAVSPAQILRNFPWLKRWDSPPRYLGAPEKVQLTQIGDRISMPASHWEQLDGHDGSKALLLTEDSALGGCYLVCRPREEQSLLPLYEESLFLMDPRNVSPSRLWQVRFTTFLQGTDNARDFDWRGCWENSPAHLAAQKGRERVLVLSQAQGWPAPKNSELIAYAQCGIRVPQRKTRPEPTAAAPAAAGIRGYTQPPPASLIFADKAEPPRNGGRRPRNRNGAKYVLIALALLLLLGAAGVVWHIRAEKDNADKAKAAKEVTDETARLAKIKRDQELQERLQSEDAQNKQRAARDANLKRTFVPQLVRAETPEPKPVYPAPQPIKPTPPPPPPPPPGADWLEQARGKLPQVPTYIVIGDLKKGVDVQTILAANHLVGKNGLILKGWKALMVESGAVEHVFLDANSNTNAKAVTIQEKDDYSMLYVYTTKILAKLDAKAMLTRDDSGNAWGHWAQATIYVASTNNPFQIAFFDSTQVSKTNAFKPAHFSKAALIQKPFLCVNKRLLSCQPFRPGVTNQLLKLHLQNQALRDLESDPLLRDLVQNNEQCVTFQVSGESEGELSINFTKIQQEINKRLATAEESEQLRRHTPPASHIYLNTNDNLNNAGGRLLERLNVECPEELKTFRNFLSHEKSFNADNWDPWREYVAYLLAVIHREVDFKIKKTEKRLREEKMDEKEEKQLRHHIEFLTNGRNAMDVKFKPFEAYAKHPDSKIIPNVKSITDGHFAEIWEEIFSKKDTSFTIKSGKDPVINHTPSKEATEIAHLTAANGVLQRPGATSHITLNMKIGDFDWPIAEFVDKP